MPGMNQTMQEFGKGQLHSGSKNGPKVTNRKQAIAIGLNQKQKQVGGNGPIDLQNRPSIQALMQR